MLSLALNPKSFRADAREVDFVASSFSENSYGFRIDQASWKLDRFRKNPVVLYAHDSWSMPIGTCSSIEVVDGELHCTVKFASAAASPKAEQVFKLAEEGVLRSVSVGFHAGDVRFSKELDCNVLYGCELYEISIVPIPSDPEAVRLAALLPQPPLAERTMSEEELTQLRADAAELATARHELAALRAERIERDVTALVGVRCLAAEVPALTKLATLDRALFDELMAARPDLSVTLGAPVMAAQAPADIPVIIDLGHASDALAELALEGTTPDAVFGVEE